MHNQSINQSINGFVCGANNFVVRYVAKSVFYIDSGRRPEQKRFAAQSFDK